MGPLEPLDPRDDWSDWCCRDEHAFSLGLWDWLCSLPGRLWNWLTGGPPPSGLVGG